eukprot:1740152-Alexandrium_andersonii.AAC.1
MESHVAALEAARGGASSSGDGPASSRDRPQTRPRTPTRRSSPLPRLPLPCRRRRPSAARAAR